MKSNMKITEIKAYRSSHLGEIAQAKVEIMNAMVEKEVYIYYVKDVLLDSYGMSSENYYEKMESGSKLLEMIENQMEELEDNNQDYSKEYWKDMKSDYVMTEGLADLIAEDISKYEIKINDHGIPYEELKSKHHRIYKELCTLELSKDIFEGVHVGEKEIFEWLKGICNMNARYNEQHLRMLYRSTERKITR